MPDTIGVREGTSNTVIFHPEGDGGRDLLSVFEEHRALLLSVASRMLGSRADAEDILQETFLRWQQAT